VQWLAISFAHPSQVKDRISQGRLAVLDLPWRNRLPSAEFGVAYKREPTLRPSTRTQIRKRTRAIKA
jgi:hypothetical protein